MNARERMRPSLRDLKPYYQAPLEGDPLRLDQNTDLRGANPALLEIDLEDVDLSQYPTKDSDALREALAAHHGVTADNVLCGNGSDELLQILTQTFTEPGGTLATVEPSYSLYPFIARLAGLKHLTVPMRGGFTAMRFDGDAMARTQADLWLVATPNNPTGTACDRASLDQLLATGTLVVVDEAYGEYAGPSMASEVEEHPNLVVLRTFSKAYGLAGLRVGYLVANKELVDCMRVVKAPYNVGVLPEAIAVAALAKQDWVEQGVRIVAESRAQLADALQARGFQVAPSHANFLLTRAPIDPVILRDALRARGILARTFANLPGTIRFTVGPWPHMETLLDAIDAALEDA